MPEAKTAKSGNDELTDLRIRKEKLELQHLENTVEAEETRKTSIARQRRVQEETIQHSNRAKAQEQAACRHKKGGKNMAGILNGNDANYSVVQHTFAHGPTIVMCTRCRKTWRKPEAALAKADPAKFKQQMEEWQTAMTWPTDNEPSGSQLFQFTEPVTAA